MLCYIAYISYDSILVSDKILQESVNWLETNQEPWELVESHWKATTSIRLNNIRRNEKFTYLNFKLNSTIQPYIIVVRLTLTKISSFFISLDKTLYKVSSVFEAIDTCFKIFHVLNVAYPVASDHIWLLIQRELYLFTTKNDKNQSYILEIISALQNIS
ncbi:hypothetical protein ALC57_09899 [Trachymyrmex cornetzi]|uniref:Uncharacterized protein n=1 Tax=Trachymyrmex cornetzi TaxID=471704 RepID=A0A151J4X2_9HYME|nr:hypothetical protein ALC57_09899 [Trachymyrmex cornetzi]